MKAVRRSRAGIHVAEIEPPGEPKPGHIAIAVHAASISKADYTKKPARGGSIAGSDAAGIVKAVGAGVDHIKIGDRVCAATEGLEGGLAETAIAPAKWTALIPESMDFAQAAALPSAGVTALAAIQKAPKSEGARVLVCGASGGVGQYATAFAKASRAEVIAACSERNKDVALAAGADQFVDYAPGLSALASRSIDAILAINGSFPAREYNRILKPGGTLVLVGADSLRPGALALPFNGKHLKAGLFFSIIGKGGLQQAVELVSRCGFVPAMDIAHGFDAAAEALKALDHTHPRGKIVAILEDEPKNVGAQ